MYNYRCLSCKAEFKHTSWDIHRCDKCMSFNLSGPLTGEPQPDDVESPQDWFAARVPNLPAREDTS
jgi:hypothetical protein